MDKIDSEEFRINKMIIRAVVVVLVVFLLSLTTCGIHRNTYNPDETRAEAIVNASRIEMRKAEHSSEMARIKILQEMVGDGIDPITARCGVEGWEESDDEICLASVTSGIVKANEAARLENQ